jgi:predicted LPLAT superfamily acyltransferase
MSEESRKPVPTNPADWAQPGIGTRLQHRFFYWLMRFGGMARGYHMANIASAWYVLLYPSIRRRCGFYLQRRFPDRTGSIQRLIDTFWLVRAYATTLVDIKVRAMFGAEKFQVASPNHDQLVEIAKKSTGFVLIHAHVGCWQVGMSTLDRMNKDATIVMAPDAHTDVMLKQTGMKLIDPRAGLQSAMQMTETLLAGNILVMMGDRTIGSDKGVVPVRFLGGDVLFPIAPFRMASATGVPVLVMTAPRTGKRAYAMQLAKVIEVPPGLGRIAKNYAPYSQQFADCLEEFVEENPWQFYNFFNMWAEDRNPNDEIRMTNQ